MSKKAGIGAVEVLRALLGTETRLCDREHIVCGGRVVQNRRKEPR